MHALGINFSFAWGTDFGKGGPLLAAKIGPGRPILAAKIGPGDHSWQHFLPKSVRGDQFWRGMILA